MISTEFAQTDPFSSSQWSKRQTGYARATNLGGEYTPQMVIGGGWQCGGGSNAGSIEHAVAAALSTAQLGHTSIQTNLAAEGLQIKISAQLLSAAATGSRVVMLAIYENRLVSKIGAGENGGREITYDYTLRKLLPAFELDPARRASLSREITIDLDPWSGPSGCRRIHSRPDIAPNRRCQLGVTSRQELRPSRL